MNRREFVFATGSTGLLTACGPAVVAAKYVLPWAGRFFRTYQQISAASNLYGFVTNRQQARDWVDYLQLGADAFELIAGAQSLYRSVALTRSGRALRTRVNIEAPKKFSDTQYLDRDFSLEQRFTAKNVNFWLNLNGRREGPYSDYIPIKYILPQGQKPSWAIEMEFKSPGINSVDTEWIEHIVPSRVQAQNGKFNTLYLTAPDAPDRLGTIGRSLTLDNQRAPLQANFGPTQRQI